MRRFDLNKSWKIIFCILLTLFTIALGLQLYLYFIYNPDYYNSVKIIPLAATWDQAKQTLGWYTLGLFCLNALVYKMPAFGTTRNQFANGFLACSVLTLLCYSVSNLLLPYIYFAQLGCLDLFLNP
jgi:hypothetical protein